MATALGHCHSYWSGRQRLVLGARFRFADIGAGGGHGSHDEPVAQGAPRQLVWFEQAVHGFSLIFTWGGHCRGCSSLRLNFLPNRIEEDLRLFCRRQPDLPLGGVAVADQIGEVVDHEGVL